MQSTTACLIRVCKACPQLKFFDMSFCGPLHEDVVEELKEKYPSICFKRSFSFDNF